MFEWGWIDELNGTAAADELARSRELLLAAEAGQFLLAAHWADLHAPDFVHDSSAVLPGMAGVVPAGPDGCPEIDEFAGAELAVLTGQSSQAGEQMVRDAVTVRHRHPQLWARLRVGEVRVWVARKVGRRCAAAGLSQAQSHWVDAETSPYVASLPLARFFDLLEAKIIEVDPLAAEQRDRERAQQRFVHAGPRDELGLRTLVARAHAGDITYVIAVIDRLATILADQGSTQDADQRRATALRILANPARALAMLLGAEEPENVADLAADMHPGGEAHWMVDVDGGALPGLPSTSDMTDLPIEDPQVAERVGALLARFVGGGAEAPAGSAALLDPAVLTRVVEALEEFDASVFDPLAVVHVHCAEETFERRFGVVRTEELGPWSARMLREWLSHPESPEQLQSRIRVRPVLDARAVVPVDRYEIPRRMAELVALRQPYEVFPYGVAVARRSDKDHVSPYRRDRSGQTDPANLAPLSRRHHRIKTHAGWTLRRDDEGIYWWRTRHGHWFHVDQTGTHHHGRDAELDARWATPQPAA